MKSITKKLFIIAVIAVLCACLPMAASCGENKGDNSGDNAVIELTLDKTEVKMLYGDETVLVPAYGGKDGEPLVWRSSDESVAVVTDGKITAVGCGSAEITVSYAGKTAKCSVTVDFGNVRPELILDGMPDVLRIGKGNSSALNVCVTYNGKKFDCDYTVDISGEDVVEYSDGKITGKRIGFAEVTIKSEWNSFGGTLMQKTIDVEVFNDVTVNSLITVGDETYASDSATVYTTEEWCGEKYGTSAKIEFIVRDNGNEKTLAGELVSGSDFVSCDNGIITAVKEGDSVYSATYTDSLGNDYTVSVKIAVVCPVSDFSDKIELCTDEAFPVEEYFGAGAMVVSAESQGKKLDVTDGVVSLVANGADTPSLTIKTNKGGYYFTDVYAYTRKITKENFAKTFTLTKNQIIDGYYVLGEDIEDLASFSQLTGDANTYFKGTFDGEGHTVKATANTNGLFGAISGGATIKNVKFVFTFPEGTDACGIAKNQNIFDNNNPVYLNNVCVITENYTDRACALMDNRPGGLEMYDVIVKINGNSALGDFTDVSSGRTALFRLDQAIYSAGNTNSFKGKFLNVRVITESFIPMANGKRWNGAIFTHYANTDEDKLGTFKRESDSRGAFMYFHIYDNNAEDSDKKTLFGKETYVYGAHAQYKNGGIFRYDTAAELIESGVSVVGSWTVE